ncbi:hypothetical protein SO694_00032320 [Aureococcus anophagefferens]|uniref:Peptidase M43 pregnancy-associated plasma-A domain-containing protein n=1 Tax=Aureococcus anophagefferens TaxID=44056 RepID=A0ABR1FKG0_AURAN
MVHGPAVVAALDRMSDGCLNATTFAPDFYADDFFETSSVRNLGFDFDDYDGVLFSPIGHCSADGSGAGWYKYVGSVDGRTVYNVQGIFMSTDLRPWCALDDAACDFAAAAPYTRDRTYVHELIHWFGFAAHSSMTDCADPDADGLSAPTPAPGACDAASWRDASLVCGECTVLVGRGLYETCDRAARLGRAAREREDRHPRRRLQDPPPPPTPTPTPQTPLTARASFAADVAAIWLARVPLRIPQCRNQP